MKKITTYKLILFIAGSLVTLTACNKLTENPSSVIVSSQFYQTSSDATSAVNAVYGTLNSDPAADFPLYGRQLNLWLKMPVITSFTAPATPTPMLGRWEQRPIFHQTACSKGMGTIVLWHKPRKYRCG